jgi:hypothetical protein
LDFPLSAGETWGGGDFTGGFAVFGTGLVRDTSVTDALHVVGKVSDYGYGLGIWFASCSDLSSFSGISFRIGGRTGARNLFDFSVQTNCDYPWQAAPLIRRGACTSADPLDPWGACEVPTVPLLSIPAVPAMLIMPWSEISGGKPVTWSAATSPSELLGFQWTFPWSATATEYQVDITLDEIRFVGGSLTEPCPTGDVRH